jgi:hypothetical protein
MPERENNFYFPVYQEAQDSIRQDTTRQDTLQPDSSVQTVDTTEPSQSLIRDTLEQTRINKPETNKLDSITREEQQRTKSQQQQKYQPKQDQKVSAPTEETDTVAVLYEITGATEIPVLEKIKDQPSYINFLYNIPATKPNKGTIKVYENGQENIQTHTEQPPKPKKILAEQPISPSFDWISYLIIALFILLGWTRIFFKRYFNTLFKSFHFINYAEELFQEKSSLTIRGATFLNGVYFIVLGLFSLQNIKYFFPSIPMAEYKLFFLSVGFFGAWYIWNAFFKQFIGSVFQKLKVFTEYFYNYNIYRKIAGIIIFPVVVINQYIQEELVMYFIYAGIIIFIIIYLIHILRGLQTFIKNKVSIFYLILYLCALEFLPLLVFYEWITKEL